MALGVECTSVTRLRFQIAASPETRHSRVPAPYCTLARVPSRCQTRPCQATAPPAMVAGYTPTTFPPSPSSIAQSHPTPPTPTLTAAETAAESSAHRETAPPSKTASSPATLTLPLQDLWTTIYWGLSFL